MTALSPDGIEGVIATKTLCRDVPVLWFSDDGGFGAQSYRLGCTYFYKKPLPPQILSAALAKCMKQSTNIPPPGGKAKHFKHIVRS